MSLLFMTINDFKGEINLDLSNDPNVILQFGAFAESVVDEILRDLLNSKLYGDLIADLDVSGEPQTQIYIDLVYGKEYVRPCGETVDYQGLRKMLRYFVYEQYLDFCWSNNTGIGQVTSEHENATSVDRGNLRKVRARIQHKSVDLYESAITFINDNYIDYFTSINYHFWLPKNKTYLGSITTVSPKNDYYMHRNSDNN